MELQVPIRLLKEQEQRILAIRLLLELHQQRILQFQAIQVPILPRDTLRLLQGLQRPAVCTRRRLEAPILVGILVARIILVVLVGGILVDTLLESASPFTSIRTLPPVIMVITRRRSIKSISIRKNTSIRKGTVLDMNSRT